MPRRIDLEQRKAQLAEAVWRTILERGIGAVSVRTVADAAGIAVGSLRHVFPTRTELLSFSAELMVQRATDRIVAAPRSGDPERDAVALLSHLLPLEPDSRAELEVNIALIAEAPATPELVPIRDQAARAILGLCRRLVESLAPGLPATRAALESRRLHALLDGLALHILAETETESADAEAPDPRDWAVRILREEIARIATLGDVRAESTGAATRPESTTRR
ncbi:TetR family transcriptional regulator [Leucobacter rhizosphaerae]|uniref:TetR family transcriptional regulator n=1 Tax=Leucobacter rhizosphaerae TaxID=2932245 RepID=A0ABY4FU30_9MICO|nr:TetR/AcrR family transcriptional regulator [Leucobacter rhizosphaerae]UOQ59775.1 TetR family transcriptional regulator [Leucobacter rhizosphaerae]